MVRFKMAALAAVVAGLTAASTARAHNPPPLTVNGVGDGTNNTTVVDPKAGQKVTIKNSDNGTGNTLIVAPDKNGVVTIDRDALGKGNKIIVERAPGEKVVIKGSGNGQNNNIQVVNVPAPGKGKSPINGLPVVAGKGNAAASGSAVAHADSLAASDKAKFQTPKTAGSTPKAGRQMASATSTRRK